MSRIRVNRAALIFIFLAVLSCIAWKMQENNLFARKAVGLVSRVVYLNYSTCERCNHSWALVDEHVTWLATSSLVSILALTISL